MKNPPPVVPFAERPLSPAHYREAALAEGRSRKVRTAAAVAAFNGWTTGLVAAASAPWALSSAADLLLTAGLATVALVEFRGRRRLLDFDRSAATLLGYNQLGLLALVAAYSLWSLSTALTGPSPFAAAFDAQPALREALGAPSDWEPLYRRAAAALYGTAIVLSVIVQGANAAYYFSRRQYVVAYLRDTPPWALDLARVAAGREIAGWGA